MGTFIVQMEFKGPLQIVEIRHAGLKTARHAQRDVNPLECESFEFGLLLCLELWSPHVLRYIVEVFYFYD